MKRILIFVAILFVNTASSAQTKSKLHFWVDVSPGLKLDGRSIPFNGVSFFGDYIIKKYIGIGVGVHNVYYETPKYRDLPYGYFTSAMVDVRGIFNPNKRSFFVMPFFEIGKPFAGYENPMLSLNAGLGFAIKNENKIGFYFNAKLNKLTLENGNYNNNVFISLGLMF